MFINQYKRTVLEKLLGILGTMPQSKSQDRQSAKGRKSVKYLSKRERIAKCNSQEIIDKTWTEVFDFSLQNIQKNERNNLD